MEHSALNHNQFVWQKIIQEALLELDPEKLKQKIGEAETAVFQRLQALGQSPGAERERDALQNASNTLLTLKNEVLKFPDWRPD